VPAVTLATMAAIVPPRATIRVRRFIGTQTSECWPSGVSAAGEHVGDHPCRTGDRQLTVA
jgi:hypothetical protein